MLVTPNAGDNMRVTGTLIHDWQEYKMVWQFLTKLNIALPYILAIVLHRKKNSAHQFLPK